ncbi:very-long-chain 3-oxoacyl-CoA reductase-like protein [Dinothrombium tinctorium]|uniref:Very-long-chain 3-oxoacyl-CoA reductase-like protein n=1 Tax=Dinothrombium tinctorium TaxID=1965070 RepID=A0A3S3S1W0_9ACAR|nr:very-long-chain 3-oxoacyl-CoA reductase-like protein [Dinothrombium tinctorium]RWS09238.1 very-long-chain 3-oxoacyl-CoA reductase-like protein [Dinothrombium tinctorium]RWS09486.1 very-long-chain 3-oxoacyl-CoA reductase-like protein [Dinothrombium tinctorium]RWS09492.1 very-long-chain 3-oxoacyl-CoA reductase-like protein [Dinothrombium tinctorium]
MASFYETVGFAFVWLSLLWLLFKLLKGIWTSFLGAAFGLNHKLQARANSWAVVTGATDGIGLEYAKQLASRGFSILLISRNPDKLQQTQQLIKSQYGKCKEVRTIAVDFGKTDIYDVIEREINSLDGDVDVLVNNVGISYTYAEYFSKIPNRLQLIEQIININIVSCTRMIDLVIPQMEKRKSGVIINVSSLSATYPSPLLSLYAASKAYIDFLSRALQIEYEDKGLIIQSILPAFVQTKMSKIRKASIMVPTPSTYVKSALNTLGLETRSYGYWAHKLQGFICDVFITGIMGADYNSRLIFKSLKEVRRKYYKKNELKEE